MNVLRALAGVGERPVDGELTDRAVVLVDVGAAAVLEVAADRVVVVAVDRRDAAFLDQGADLVRMRAVADQVAAAVDGVDGKAVDLGERRLERGQVGVDVGDHGDAVHTRSLSRATSTRPSWEDAVSVSMRRLVPDELVDERAERGADDRREDVEPERVQVAGDERGPDRAGGVHRGARDRAAEHRVEADGAADRDRRGLADGARVGGDGHDHEHQEEASARAPRGTTGPASRRGAWRRRGRCCRASRAGSPPRRARRASCAAQ